MIFIFALYAIYTIHGQVNHEISWISKIFTSKLLENWVETYLCHLLV